MFLIVQTELVQTELVQTELVVLIIASVVETVKQGKQPIQIVPKN